MRTLTSQEEDALAASHGVGCWLIEIGWSSPGMTFRGTTFDRSVDWNGFEWRGMASLVAVEAIKETTGLFATQYRLGLPGISTDAIAQALLPTKGTPVRIYDASINPDDGSVIASPQMIDDATIDRTRISIARGTCEVTAFIQSEIADFRRRRVIRWTDADQRAMFPNDTSLRFVSQMSQRTLYFPSREAQL